MKKNLLIPQVSLSILMSLNSFSQSIPIVSNRPIEAPGGSLSTALSIASPQNTPRPASLIDYKNNRLSNLTNNGMGFCYDDILFM